MASAGPLPAKEVADKFFALIGVCVTEWAGIDEWIFRLFKQCVFPERQAAIIYYRSPGLNIRLSLTDEILKSVFPKPRKKVGSHPSAIEQEWNTLKKDIEGQLGIRRRIAHQPIKINSGWLGHFLHGRTTLAGNDFDPEELADSWFSIYATEHERMREKEANSEPLKLDDLKTHLKTLSSLTPRLVTFSDNLQEWLSAKPSQPVPQPSRETSEDHAASAARRSPRPPRSSPA